MSLTETVVMRQLLRSAQAGLAQADVRTRARVAKAYRRGVRAGRGYAFALFFAGMAAGALVMWAAM